MIHSAETVTIIFIMRPAREQTLWSALDTVQRAMTDSDRKVFGHVWTTLLPVSIPSDEGEDPPQSRFARKGEGSVSVGLVIGAGVPPPLERSDREGEQGLQAGQEGGSPTNADAMMTAADSVSCVGGSVSGSSSASAASVFQSGATRGRKKRQKVYYDTVQFPEILTNATVEGWGSFRERPDAIKYKDKYHSELVVSPFEFKPILLAECLSYILEKLERPKTFTNADVIVDMTGWHLGAVRATYDLSAVNWIMVDHVKKSDKLGIAEKSKVRLKKEMYTAIECDTGGRIFQFGDGRPKKDAELLELENDPDVKIAITDANKSIPDGAIDVSSSASEKGEKEKGKRKKNNQKEKGGGKGGHRRESRTSLSATARKEDEDRQNVFDGEKENKKGNKKSKKTEGEGSASSSSALASAGGEREKQKEKKRRAAAEQGEAARRERDKKDKKRKEKERKKRDRDSSYEPRSGSSESEEESSASSNE
uniref:Uncharacterized protein n=1 Tax=Chromera velia CCMP2878 TaxID=1169474 RepID=A0A0G4GNY3_9ALVE|eukprot:Cvel_22737.t1-p1 / transcript=Cvel_22737.t1 / gene=Cvel_22737 / organism=Chromera_velia_CCMP2878 / gene_product=hypothetical protein / transcript_product=hypothetical protein / location=Cvel_scaffold2267:25807-27828(-) / protein_length=479 / sequence_SO=supercontig / SO=protein_coding / is_pseudo=false